MKYTLWLVLSCVLAGCATTNSQSADPAPSVLLGNYQDDYGIAYTIEENLWYQHPDALYHIVQWFPEDNYLIAQNDTSNVSDGGLWTRIDWLELSGMDPYTWAFCLSTYNASSAEEAASVRIAQRETPRTGCNGFPFSRMQPKP